jgi:hypothetical protein
VTVFVAIAAYRDRQLVPTIVDCLAKARHPDDLRFGICWQHGADEAPLPFAGDPRFRIVDVDWRQSQGMCWARAETMRLWEGEPYFLQLDSHHRFVQDWDARLFHHAERTGSAKPLVTAYGPPFTPGDPDVLNADVFQIEFDRFTEEGIALIGGAAIPRWRSLDRPLRARFLSGHLIFTLGDFVREVPSDPDLYFVGDEIILTIRAYTHGYDLFHPPETIVWHEYKRIDRTPHWRDHAERQGVERSWRECDAVSRAKMARFLAEPWVGPFGCGPVRTLAEYEAYAGISFRHRRVQEYTRRGEEPPNPPMPADWAERPSG